MPKCYSNSFLAVVGEAREWGARQWWLLQFSFPVDFVFCPWGLLVPLHPTHSPLDFQAFGTRSSLASAPLMAQYPVLGFERQVLYHNGPQYLFSRSRHWSQPLHAGCPDALSIQACMIVQSELLSPTAIFDTPLCSKLSICRMASWTFL